MDFYEQLQAVLGSKVTDADLKGDLATEIDRVYSEAVAKLKANKEDIVNEKRTLKAEFDAYKAQTAGLEGKTAEDFKRLEEDIAKLRANPGDEEKLKQLEAEYKVRLEQAERDKLTLAQEKERELAEARTKIKALEQAQDKALCSGELKKALQNIGVKDVHMAMLTRSLLLDTFIKEVDGKKVVKFNGGTGNVTFDIMEGITMWGKEPNNAIYLGAPKNTGAGAGGSGNTVTNLLKRPFNQLTASEQSELYKADPALYEKARKTANTAIRS